MRRRDSDPRPPVEVIGAEPADEPQRVAIGSDRRSARWRGMLVAAGVAMLVIGGLVLGGGEDDPAASSGDEAVQDAGDRGDDASSTTRRARRTTTTTTTLPAGPVLPSQTGGGLLIIGPGRSGTYVDLDTGARHDVSRLSPDYWSVQGVTGGVVITEGGTAFYVPLPAGERVELGPAEQVLTATSDDRVWLMTGLGFEREAQEQRAVLTDLAGRRSAEVVLPTCCAMAGTDRGVVFSTGGRTYLADGSGVAPLVDGNVVHVSGDRVVRDVCNDEAICTTEVLNLQTGAVTSFDTTPDVSLYGRNVLIAPDGRVAVIVYGPTGSTLVVYGSNGREVGRVELRQGTEPAWLPGGHGLVAVGNGLRPERIFDRNSQLVSEPIPALEGLLGERIVVITP